MVTLFCARDRRTPSLHPSRENAWIRIAVLTVALAVVPEIATAQTALSLDDALRISIGLAMLPANEEPNKPLAVIKIVGLTAAMILLGVGVYVLGNRK